MATSTILEGINFPATSGKSTRRSPTGYNRILSFLWRLSELIVTELESYSCSLTALVGKVREKPGISYNNSMTLLHE